MLHDAIKRIRQVAEVLDDNDPEKLDMLNIEGDYESLMNWAITKYNDASVTADACKAMKDKYARREQSMKKNMTRFKDILAIIMESANETKFKGIATVSYRHVPPRPIIQNADLIPDKYVKIERKIDKTAINNAYKNGETIEGVTLDNGGKTISIRI